MKKMYLYFACIAIFCCACTNETTTVSPWDNSSWKLSLAVEQEIIEAPAGVSNDDSYYIQQPNVITLKIFNAAKGEFISNTVILQQMSLQNNGDLVFPFDYDEEQSLVSNGQNVRYSIRYQGEMSLSLSNESSCQGSWDGEVTINYNYGEGTETFKIRSTGSVTGTRSDK